MMHDNAILALEWLTIARIIIGVCMATVLMLGLYKFKKFVLTAIGLALLTNLICLYIIMEQLS